MCGIVGVTRETTGGETQVTILEGPVRLERRGYSSAGVAVADVSATNPKLHVTKEVEKLTALQAALETKPLPPAITAIGHTRWATREGVTHEDAHLHLSFNGKLASIHNGTIEDADACRARLQATDITMVSETDIEVVAHPSGHVFLAEPKPKGECEESVFPVTVTLHSIGPENRHPSGATRSVRTMNWVTRDLEGPFTSLAIHEETPEVIVAVRRPSPLIAGLDEDTSHLGSDVLTLAGKTKQALEIDQDEVVIITPAEVLVLDGEDHEILYTCGLEVFTADPENQDRRPKMDFATDRAIKEGYGAFMKKGIREQPRAVAETLKERLDVSGALTLDELCIGADILRGTDSVIIIACGTTAYAEQVVRYAIEHWCHIPCEVELAHELRYCDPVVGIHTLVVAVS